MPPPRSTRRASDYQHQSTDIIDTFINDTVARGISLHRHPPRPLVRRQVFRRSPWMQSRQRRDSFVFSHLSHSFFFPLSLSFFLFFQHYCIPPQEKQGLVFSLSVSISSPAPPHNCPSFLLSFAVFLSPRPPCYPLSLPVHPFLCPGTSRGSGSQVTLKNLADGRKIGDTYIIHCVSLSLFFLPRRSVPRERTMYLTNCSRSYRQIVSYIILRLIKIIYSCTLLFYC